MTGTGPVTYTIWRHCHAKFPDGSTLYSVNLQFVFVQLRREPVGRSAEPVSHRYSLVFIKLSLACLMAIWLLNNIGFAHVS